MSDTDSVFKMVWSWSFVSEEKSRRWILLCQFRKETDPGLKTIKYLWFNYVLLLRKLCRLTCRLLLAVLTGIYSAHIEVITGDNQLVPFWLNWNRNIGWNVRMQPKKIKLVYSCNINQYFGKTQIKPTAPYFW